MLKKNSNILRSKYHCSSRKLFKCTWVVYIYLIKRFPLGIWPLDLLKFTYLYDTVSLEPCQVVFFVLNLLYINMVERLKNQIKYWYSSGLDNWGAALDLYKSKRFDACLFFCHLSVEKLLKGLVTIKTEEVAPKIHDLSKLANLAGLKLSKNKVKSLRILTTFNIACRYPDEKLDFYKQCTRAFTSKYLKVSKEIILWLKEEYHQK